MSEIKRANLALRARHPGLTPEALEPIYYREALAFIREQPMAWAGLMARKVFYSGCPNRPFVPAALPRRTSGRRSVSYVGVLPFAVLGLVGLVRRGRAPMPLVLLAVGVRAGVARVLPGERYRIPVADPALLVCRRRLAGARG